MNIADYLITLDARSTWRSNPKDLSSKLDPEYTNNGELKLYAVHMIVEQRSGVFTGVRQEYYVTGEGTAEETVLEAIKEAKDDQSNGLEGIARTWIDNNFVDASKIIVTIDSINEEHNFVIVTAYEVSAGTITPKRYLLHRNGGVNIYEYMG